MNNLRKRTHLVFQKMTESVHSDEVRFDLKVERPRVLFEGKYLDRIERKANQLSARLFDLEESVKGGLSNKKFVEFIEANIGFPELFIKRN